MVLFIMADRQTSFIEQLFNTISNDPTMPAELKLSLMRLQLPIHTLSLNDPHFLSNDKHPARKTLLIAKRLSNYAKKDTNLIKKIDIIISELYSSSSTATQFASANNQFERLIQQLQINNSNAPAQEQAPIDKVDLKTYLNKKIKLCLQGNQIPNECKVLILKLWPAALFHLIKTHGEKTRHWNNALDMFMELIDSLQPLSSIEEYRSLKDSYMKIARSNNNMLLLYHDEKNVEASIKSLIAHYNHILGNSNYGQAAHNMRQISVLDKISSLPSNIKPGVWCEIFIDDAIPKRRLRLSLINIETGMLLFVNRNGVKKLEKDALEFSEELRKGLSRIYTHAELFSSQSKDESGIRKIS